jgi:signal transduction histidine kinase
VRKSDCFCPELKSGRSVYLRRDRADLATVSIAAEAAKSSMIVPFHVEGEYAGAVGFDDYRAPREFDPAVVAALEIAASVIGAAYHRLRLIDAVRREREAAIEQRVAELVNANAALRANLEQLTSVSELPQFFQHMLLEAVRQLDAAAGSVFVLYTSDEWRVVSHVRDGRIEEPSFSMTARESQLQYCQRALSREPVHVAISDACGMTWPGMLDYHLREGHRSVYKLPLVFGNHIVGMLSLAFRAHDAIGPQHSAFLEAMALQASLAVGLKRLGITAKNAAVLAERNRIGQEIHDGLAQAFTGILMQLGATEEMPVSGELENVLRRIRELAREGLQEARRSVLALRPSEPRAGGLELALRQLAERSTVSDRLVCRFTGDATPTGLPPEHEHELLRIAQEAVSNAVRHARPNTVEIHLGVNAGTVSLIVSDDGCGMRDRPERYAQQGFGLNNMRERAHAIGGVWRIESSPEEGTRVSVRIARAAGS